jgi:hypothetical protein
MLARIIKGERPAAPRRAQTAACTAARPPALSARRPLTPPPPSSPLRLPADLSGLGIDEEYDEIDSDAASSPTRRRRRRLSRAPSAASLGGGGGDAAHLAPPPRGRWGAALLGGARDLLGGLADLAEPDGDGAGLSRPAPPDAEPPAGDAGGAAAAAAALLASDTRAPEPLEPPLGAPPPALDAPSGLLGPGDAAALAAAVPLRHRQCRWALLYSTQRDGVSLRSLLRVAAGRAPTLLLVRDMRRAVFGAYCPEPWRPCPRHFGTGEAFVFALAPGRRALWRWWAARCAAERNDFFQWCEPGRSALAVGGAGGYALRLDAELARGRSAPSATFGNAPLAGPGAEDFEIGAVELWALEE